MPDAPRAGTKKPSGPVTEAWIYQGAGRKRERLAVVGVADQGEQEYVVDSLERLYGPGIYRVEWKDARRRYVTSTVVEVAAGALPQALPHGRRRPARLVEPARTLGEFASPR